MEGLVVSPDEFADALDKILSQQMNSKRDKADEVITKGTRKIANDIRSNARAFGWGDHTDYPKDWKAQADKYSITQLSHVVYHKTKPGLPHLLEFGHYINKSAKRTKAYPHVAPAYNNNAPEIFAKLSEVFRS